jgi:CRISPR-associated protein Cmr4
MLTRPFLLHALSPLHSGTGQAADIIDLPTARMKATGIPFLPGSSIKGVLRDARRESDHEKTEAVFAPSDDPAAHAGALVVGDAPAGVAGTQLPRHVLCAAEGLQDRGK